METVFESLKGAMGRGQRIELRKFGVFSVKPRKTGIGRNPRTGEEVSIPPGKAVRFKPGKELQGLEDTPLQRAKPSKVNLCEQPGNRTARSRLLGPYLAVHSRYGPYYERFVRVLQLVRCLLAIGFFY